MVHNDIELVENDYFRIPLARPSRKIKFKGISFKNILSRWNNFRLERLKKKLESQKEKLVGMEFTAAQVQPGANKDKTEEKIDRKTQAIARLESKINFLETGNYYSEEFVDSRAIKLKELMMKNLEKNLEYKRSSMRGDLYGLTEKAAEEIMSNNSVDSIIDAETEKIGARVREILAEKEAARKAAANAEPAVESIPPIGPGLPGYGDSTSAETTNENISSATTNEVIDDNMAGINVTPVVSTDEVAAAIDFEMQKIKVSGNESTPAKVNKFINEDGTYRLRREDIDEDFRITRFDRSKLPVSETAPVNAAEEPEIPPFSTTAAKRITPNVDAPRKAITAIVERKVHEFPKIVLPTIKESFAEPEETADRVVPVVVPDRQQVSGRVKSNVTVEPEFVAEEQQGYDELSALMAKVYVLKAQKRTIENLTEDAKQKANSVDSAHKEMMRRLHDYASLLEEDCNASYQSMSEVEQTAATKEAQINAMIEIMSSGEPQAEANTGRVK